MTRRAIDSTLTTFNLTPLLVAGTSIVTAIGQTGPASFAGCASACAYSMNPAGVVFGGTLMYH